MFAVMLSGIPNAALHAGALALGKASLGAMQQTWREAIHTSFFCTHWSLEVDLLIGVLMAALTRQQKKTQGSKAGKERRLKAVHILGSLVLLGVSRLLLRIFVLKNSR